MRYKIVVVYGMFHIVDISKDETIYTTPVGENAKQIVDIMNFDTEHCYEVYKK